MMNSQFGVLGRLYLVLYLERPKEEIGEEQEKTRIKYFIIFWNWRIDKISIQAVFLIWVVIAMNDSLLNYLTQNTRRCIFHTRPLNYGKKNLDYRFKTRC